jgi:hypothetical protein
MTSAVRLGATEGEGVGVCEVVDGVGEGAVAAVEGLSAADGVIRGETVGAAALVSPGGRWADVTASAPPATSRQRASARVSALHVLTLPGTAKG